MPTIQVEAQLSSNQLLEAASQMSLPELEQFVAQLIALQSRRKAPSLSQAESELLVKVNQDITPEMRARLNELIAKRRAEALTAKEHNELLHLTNQVEKVEAARAEALAQLARLRGVTMTTLMHDLGIRIPDYA